MEVKHLWETEALVQDLQMMSVGRQMGTVVKKQYIRIPALGKGDLEKDVATIPRDCKIYTYEIPAY